MYRAYAKINLGLLILEKRPDGFHNIETLFHRVDVYDEIAFSESPTIRVMSSSDQAPSNETNICFKAASLLKRHLRIEMGVRIAITKNIPVGAGLGGGSSDAATVLRHLPRFWNKSVGEQTLKEFALQLGSDVPFFLGNASALGMNRGEQLEYFELDIPHAILICTPMIHISTAWAYKQITANTAPRETHLREILSNGIAHTAQLAAQLKNDFEPIVFAAYPEILHVKETMMRNGALFASMSGSGSSVYGFFEEDRSAEEVSTMLREKGYRTFLTPAHFKP